MKKFAIALVLVLASAFSVQACDRTPIRDFINAVRPGVLIPKRDRHVPQYQPQATFAAPSGPVVYGSSGGGGCPGGKCPLTDAGYKEGDKLTTTSGQVIVYTEGRFVYAPPGDPGVHVAVK